MQLRALADWPIIRWFWRVDRSRRVGWMRRMGRVRRMWWLIWLWFLRIFLAHEFVLSSRCGGVLSYRYDRIAT
jgi:hypothetical protein